MHQVSWDIVRERVRNVVVPAHLVDMDPVGLGGLLDPELLRA